MIQDSLSLSYHTYASEKKSEIEIVHKLHGK